MPRIYEDGDLPESLNTPEKQTLAANELLIKHFGRAAVHIESSEHQGLWSRTLFVALADGRDVVVQFRTTPVNLDSFKVARAALGDIVPESRALASKRLRDEGAWAYASTFMPGVPWNEGLRLQDPECHTALAVSLGRVFSQGSCADHKVNAALTTLRRRLNLLLTSQVPEIVPHRYLVQTFIDRLEEFAQLPMWIAHYDLNTRNVLVDDDCFVVGLIDWELSEPLPFGAGFGCIHKVGGSFGTDDHEEFQYNDCFVMAERGFWDALFINLPTTYYEWVQKHIKLVQDAVILGTLINCVFYLADGGVDCNGPYLRALPQLLTYRIPQIRRDDEPPYLLLN
jgi:hypothetical protein